MRTRITAQSKVDILAAKFAHIKEKRLGGSFEIILEGKTGKTVKVEKMLGVPAEYQIFDQALAVIRRHNPDIIKNNCIRARV